MRGPKTTLKWERYSDVSDGMGNVTRTWTHKGYLSGVFFPMSGFEKYMFSKVTEEVTHTFLVEIRPDGDDPTVKDRFKTQDQARSFEIVYTDGTSVNINRSNFIKCTLKELV
jgi:head-tail adaptor